MQATLRQSLIAVVVLFVVVFAATTLALRIAYRPATGLAGSDPVSEGAQGSASSSGSALSITPSREIDSASVQRILLQLDAPTRQAVLESAAAFRQIAEAEAQRRSVINAAIDTGFESGEAVQTLMARAAERVLGETYLAQVVSGNLDPNFPSDEQLVAWFAENADRFGLPERRHLWQIFLAVPDDADADTEARVRAEAAKLAKAGAADLEAFQALALEHSQHAPSQVNRGYMGLLPGERLKPELREAVSALEPGEVSAPLRSAAGFHVVRSGESVPAFAPSLDEVAADARAAMRQEARIAIRNAALAQIRESYPVALDDTLLETWRLELLMNQIEREGGLPPARTE